MRIGIDGSSILPQRTGIGNYTYNIIKHLLEIDKKNEYVIFLNSWSNPVPDYDFLKGNNVTIKHFRIPGPFLIKSWKYLKFPTIDFLTGEVDVFHSPSTYIPPQKKGARITTVHDLYFMRNPEGCENLGGKFFMSTLAKLLPLMDKIIVPSYFTKNEMIELLKIPEKKISVIYEGVDYERFSTDYNDEITNAVMKEYCLPASYILYVGTIEPRKNLEGLLIAYKRLCEILNNPPKIVIVGRKGLESEKFFEQAAQMSLFKNIVWTGYVPNDHLPLIYKNALLFVYPSLYEGFGLPVLEAMASGIPVIVSENSAMTEVAGDDVCYINPENFHQMAEKMKMIITSRKNRHEMTEKSRIRAAQFSWKLTAEKTLKVYEAAYNENKNELKK